MLASHVNVLGLRAMNGYPTHPEASTAIRSQASRRSASNVATSWRVCRLIPPHNETYRRNPAPGYRVRAGADAGITFHGGQPTDSSPNGGTRHFEIYNNNFKRVSNAIPINKWIWVRGSSGIIANNVMDRAESPDGSSYPNKNEIRLTVGCPTAYPVQHQAGQSNISPENPPSHPLAIFGNTGAGTTDANFISVAGSDTAGPPCATPATYIQKGRDYVLSNTWGWSPYVYPHPLQSVQ